MKNDDDWILKSYMEVGSSFPLHTTTKTCVSVDVKVKDREYGYREHILIYSICSLYP